MTTTAREMNAWIGQGACRQTDPEAFFPEVGQQAEAAKRICVTLCGVRAQCLRWALGVDGNQPEEFGVWGGKSRRERARERKRLGITALPIDPRARARVLAAKADNSEAIAS